MPSLTSKTEELVGVFAEERIVRGADDSPDRWIVGNLEGYKTVVGCATANSLVPGHQYRFLGSWRTHDSFGKQFAFTSFVECEPTDLAAIQRYLARSYGIGPVAAARIVGKYGEASLVECRENPIDVGVQCNIAPNVMLELEQTLKKNKALERILIEIDTLFHGGGFPKGLAQAVIEEWGEQSCNEIRQNPFVLRSFPGVGFAKCDALYQRLGLPMDSMERQVHCVLYAIESDITGSTWVHADVILRELKSKLAGVTPKFHLAIQEAINREMIRERDGWYATAKNADSESSMVSDIANAIGEEIDEFGFY